MPAVRFNCDRHWCRATNAAKYVDTPTMVPTRIRPTHLPQDHKCRCWLRSGALCCRHTSSLDQMPEQLASRSAQCSAPACMHSLVLRTLLFVGRPGVANPVKLCLATPLNGLARVVGIISVLMTHIACMLLIVYAWEV